MARIAVDSNKDLLSRPLSPASRGSDRQTTSTACATRNVGGVKGPKHTTTSASIAQEPTLLWAIPATGGNATSSLGATPAMQSGRKSALRPRKHQTARAVAARARRQGARSDAPRDSCAAAFRQEDEGRNKLDLGVLRASQDYLQKKVFAPPSRIVLTSPPRVPGSEPSNPFSKDGASCLLMRRRSRTRSQPDRAGILEAEGGAAQGCGAHRDKALETAWTTRQWRPRSVLTIFSMPDTVCDPHQAENALVLRVLKTRHLPLHCAILSQMPSSRRSLQWERN
jgi:hypothetical protein